MPALSGKPSPAGGAGRWRRRLPNAVPPGPDLGRTKIRHQLHRSAPPRPQRRPRDRRRAGRGIRAAARRGTSRSRLSGRTDPAGVPPRERDRGWGRASGAAAGLEGTPQRRARHRPRPVGRAFAPHRLDRGGDDVSRQCECLSGSRGRTALGAPAAAGTGASPATGRPPAGRPVARPPVRSCPGTPSAAETSCRRTRRP